MRTKNWSDLSTEFVNGPLNGGRRTRATPEQPGRPTKAPASNPSSPNLSTRYQDTESEHKTKSNMRFIRNVRRVLATNGEAATDAPQILCLDGERRRTATAMCVELGSEVTSRQLITVERDAETLARMSKSPNLGRVYGGCICKFLRETNAYFTGGYLDTCGDCFKGPGNTDKPFDIVLAFLRRCKFDKDELRHAQVAFGITVGTQERNYTKNRTGPRARDDRARAFVYNIRRLLRVCGWAVAPHTWYQNHYHKTEGAVTSPMLTIQCVLVRTGADLARIPTVSEINSRYSRGFILDRNFDTPVVLGLGQR